MIPVGETDQNYTGQILAIDDEGYVRKVKVDGGGVDVTGRDFSAKIDLLSTNTNTPIVLFNNKTEYATKVNMIPVFINIGNCIF